MRNFNDRQSSGNRTRWDEDIPQTPLDKKPRRFRLVGPLQDIATHWCLLNAGEHADKIAEKKREARRRGSEYKKLRDPKGVPFLCPKFDLFREEFIDWKDTDGFGFLNREVLTASDLERHGIDIPSSLRKNRNRRFSPRSIDQETPVLVEPVCCPMHDDFGKRAGKRTWWHAFERQVDSRGNVRGNRGLTIVGKSGFPISAYIDISKIARIRRMDPSDPKEGYDLILSMDSSLPAQQMYDVREVRGEDSHPLTKQERMEAFGRYILHDGTKCNIMKIFELRSKDPKRLRGMRTVQEAGIFNIEDMAAATVDADAMKEFMVQQGYYNPDGSPRVELVETKDENDNSWSDRDDSADSKRRTRSRRSREDRPSREESPEKTRTKSRTKTKSRPKSDETRVRKKPSRKRKRSSLVDDDI